MEIIHLIVNEFVLCKNISRIVRGTDHQFHHRDHSPINHLTHCKYKTETLRVTQKFELNANIKKYNAQNNSAANSLIDRECELGQTCPGINSHTIYRR